MKASVLLSSADIYVYQFSWERDVSVIFKWSVHCLSQKITLTYQIFYLSYAAIYVKKCRVIARNLFQLTLRKMPLKLMCRFVAEIVFIRYQFKVLFRTMTVILRLINPDRWVLVILYRLFPSIIHAAQIIKSETLVR